MRFKTILIALGAALALAACVSQSTYNKEVQVSNTYKQLDAQLQGEVKSDQAQITQLQNLVRVTLSNAIVFSEGGVTLHKQGEATLDKVAPVLKGLTGQTIEVKGFTDNVPIGPELKARYPTNVALSKARADEVVKYLASRGVPAGMMTATGYGDAQPVASNETPQGRAKNRRVEIDIAEAKK